MKTAFAYLVATFFLMTVARSATIYGAGTASCGAWLADRNGADIGPKEQWVLGYLTAEGVYLGLGSAEGRPIDLLAQTDADGAFAWIDAYCAAHPLDTLSLAVDHLSAGLTLKHLHL